MRGFNMASISRFAIVALMTASVAIPVLLDATLAGARAPGGPAGSTSGPSGSTGGASGSTGGSTGGGGAARSNELAAVLPIARPRPIREIFPRPSTPRSCYQSEPMFDRWGDYVGKRQDDFCW